MSKRGKHRGGKSIGHTVGRMVNYRMDQEVPIIGSLTRGTGTSDSDEHQRRRLFVLALAARAKTDSVAEQQLWALKRCEVSIAELYERRNDAAQTLALGELKAPLFATATAVFSAARKKDREALDEKSKARYLASIAALALQLPATMTVGDLATVNWNALADRWLTAEAWQGVAVTDAALKNGAATRRRRRHGKADFNRMRQAVLCFLSRYLGGISHPFRFPLVDKIPKLKEPKKTKVVVTLDQFWKVVNAAPTHARPGIVVMGLLGLRIEEYEALTPERFDMESGTLDLKGIKGHDGEEGENQLWVPEGPMRAWVNACCPPPMFRKSLRTHLTAACAAAGVKRLTPHMLRHNCGMWLSDLGFSDAKIATILRHRDARTTRIYTRGGSKRSQALALSDAAFAAQEITPPDAKVLPLVAVKRAERTLAFRRSRVTVGA